MSKRLKPRIEKVAFDDFVPRFEYPESMQSLEDFSVKVGEKKLSYGKYVAKYGTGLDAPIKKDYDQRKCRDCKRMFTPPRLKDGSISQKEVRCPKCIEKIKNRVPKKPPNDYPTNCAWCGNEIVIHCAPGKGRNYFCKTCKKRNRYGALRQKLKENENGICS